VLGLLLAIAAVRQVIASQTATPAKGERFTAVLVNLNIPGGANAQPIDININRWSTDAERDALINTILEADQKRALDVLQKMPSIGNIRSPQSIGYDLRFATRTSGANGSERVLIVTDRPIGFWEAREAPRSIDYPFTVIELQINSNGRGDGKMTVGTKITADREERTIVLENYSVQPVMLNDVRRSK
jgi:hypothetical protein